MSGQAVRKWTANTSLFEVFKKLHVSANPVELNIDMERV